MTHFRFIVIPLMGAAIAWSGIAREARGQQPLSAKPATSSRKAIGFRLADWKTSHFHDAAAADQTEQTLKKIGCETERQNHDGHIDLRFRCPTWKQLTVESDEQLVQWHQWLGNLEMLTMVVDPPLPMNLVTVRFKLDGQRHLHVKSADEAASMRQVLEMMGCDVEQAEHNGHIDLTFRCPQWKSVGFPDHPTAHSWQDWLRQQGFATEHNH
jgi:hypothetical protein